MQHQNPKVMKTSSEEPTSPSTRKIQDRMRQLIDDLRAEVGEVSAPRSQALFETAAEVLTGLVKAFNDHDKKNEPAWQNPPPKARAKAGRPT